MRYVLFLSLIYELSGLLRNEAKGANLGNSDGRDAGRSAERRRFGRRSTLKRATIVTEDGVQTACFVVDISDNGARLKLGNPSSVPDRFGLMIEADDFSVRCAVVRREDAHLGIKFVGSPRRLSWFRNRSRLSQLNFVLD
ncbi:Type IV pilus assembly PilZ (modular protein) [Candidatus Filomicrobium marinum]|uniref:Type IV pilus assembly PilZ (Modular protein) n=1 Tax=Candidatus Filomicrobium marinum TaxID=1608628 RepID=A0A0D6JD26_9HYPH|nr:Type IV pilus assembly PilZ (modular protein) [Candidatus Filomicrobium marinum]CPR17401.1 Type IV pilus assembly PilZ (modular protein) [Candidatus Filomicrobium marinum]